MEPSSSLVPAEERAATHADASPESPRGTDVVGIPWGGPEFLRLLALFSGTFLATSCFILGAWYLVLRPAPVAGASHDELRSVVQEEVREALGVVEVGGVYAGRLGSRPISLKVEVSDGGKVSGFVQRDGKELAATGSFGEDGTFVFTEEGTGLVWTGSVVGDAIEGRVMAGDAVEGPFKVER